MGVQTRILVVHDDPALVARLRAELGEVTAVSSPEEARQALAGDEAELVITDDKVDVAFLEDLSQRSPRTRRVVLLDGGDRRPWLEAAAEGYRFAAIPEAAPDLVERLRALVRAEVEATSAFAGCTVEAAAASGGAVVSGALIRLANETLTFRLEPGDSLEHFLPGRELERVSVRRGREAIIDGCAASVRDIFPDQNGGFELELALGAPPAPPPPEEVVRDAMQCAALVGEALRRGQLQVEAADGAAPRAVVRGRVDALAGLLLVEEPTPELAPGVTLRFSFTAGGAHYRFVSSLSRSPVSVARPALSAPLPSELRGRRRRRSRIAMAPGESTAELTPLLGSQPVRRPVIDVEMAGMGFLAEPSDLLPVGTRLPVIRVDLGEGVVLRASGRIASRTPSGAPGGSAVRQGVVFDPLAPEEQAALAAAALRHAHPGLELARGLTFDALWCFLRETGFLYPEKEAKLRAVLPEIHRSLSRLLGRPDGPLRTLLFRAGGLIAGHVSAVRAYRSTWMVQHLAALKDGPGRLAVAPALNVGVVDYLEQLPDCEWGRIWFRPNNRWPARTFGRFARLQFDPHRCDIRTYAYLVAPTAGAPEAPRAPGLRIAPAGAADWAEIRRHLAGTGKTASLAAEDLCRAPDLTEASEPFRALGLERRREALVARRDGRLSAYALLEISSMGLNFSELTNAFRLCAIDRDPAATAALAAAARDRYAGLGRAIAIGLDESPDPVAWQAAGFTQAKSYTCFTWHRSMVRRYVDYIQRLYECLPSRVTRRPA